MDPRWFFIPAVLSALADVIVILEYLGVSPFKGRKMESLKPMNNKRKAILVLSLLTASIAFAAAGWYVVVSDKQPSYATWKHYGDSLSPVMMKTFSNEEVVIDGWL